MLKSSDFFLINSIKLKIKLFKFYITNSNIKILLKLEKKVSGFVAENVLYTSLDIPLICRTFQPDRIYQHEDPVFSGGRGDRLKSFKSH
jgi:hypothetical protein